MTFQFQCPFCGVSITAGLQSAAFEVQCPACRRDFVVDPPPSAVRVQAVAVPDRHELPGMPRRTLRRIVVRRSRGRLDDSRARLVMISMIVGGPVLLGGILWGGLRLKEKLDAAPQGRSVREDLKEVKERELDFLEREAEQRRIDNERWERKHREITEREER